MYTSPLYPNSRRIIVIAYLLGIREEYGYSANLIISEVLIVLRKYYIACAYVKRTGAI